MQRISCKGAGTLTLGLEYHHMSLLLGKSFFNIGTPRQKPAAHDFVTQRARPSATQRRRSRRRQGSRGEQPWRGRKYSRQTNRHNGPTKPAGAARCGTNRLAPRFSLALSGQPL